MNPVSHPKIIALSLAMVGLVAASANAISSGVGDLRVVSHLGQPFKATLEISKGMNPNCLSVVPNPMGDPGTPELTKAKIGLTKSRLSVVEIVGFIAETNPLLTVTVKDSCGTGNNMKTFNVLLDPDLSDKNAQGFSVKSTSNGSWFGDEAAAILASDSAVFEQKAATPKETFSKADVKQGVLTTNALGNNWKASGTENMLLVSRWLFGADREAKNIFIAEFKKLNPGKTVSEVFKIGTVVNLPSKSSLGIAEPPPADVLKTIESARSQAPSPVIKDETKPLPIPAPVFDEKVSPGDDVAKLEARQAELTAERDRLKQDLVTRIASLEAQVANLRRLLSN